MTVILRARAKINWALNITGRRADGYHLLDMLMQSIDLADELSFEPADSLSLWAAGAECAAPQQNLVVRAADALNAFAGTGFGARIELKKRIPERAGLGGGSADCALALRALNRMWGLDLPEETLMEIGAKLGADVPFCLAGGLARVRGIGEAIDPVPGAPEIPLVLLRPGGGLSTAAVFKLWDEGGYPAVRLDAAALADAVVRRDLAAVDRLCANALTAPAVSLMPEIGEAMDAMRRLGAGAAFMTGSGSAVVGAFDDGETARAAAVRLPGSVLAHTCRDGGFPGFFA